MYSKSRTEATVLIDVELHVRNHTEPHVLVAVDFCARQASTRFLSSGSNWRSYNVSQSGTLITAPHKDSQSDRT